MQKASASRAETSASMQNLSASMQITSASMQNLSASMQNTSASMQNTFASTQMSPYAAPENADVRRTWREEAAKCGERASKRREKSQFK
jgi:methyl-accepting chemotaxis protein